MFLERSAEYQHNRYGCDLDRMIELGQQLKAKGIFIRFNPDSFNVQNKNKVVSFTERIAILLKTFNIAVNKTECKTLEVSYLYYDDFNKSNIEFTDLSEYSNGMQM